MGTDALACLGVTANEMTSRVIRAELTPLLPAETVTRPPLLVVVPE